MIDIASWPPVEIIGRFVYDYMLCVHCPDSPLVIYIAPSYQWRNGFAPDVHSIVFSVHSRSTPYDPIRKGWLQWMSLRQRWACVGHGNVTLY